MPTVYSWLEILILGIYPVGHAIYLHELHLIAKRYFLVNMKNGKTYSWLDVMITGIEMGIFRHEGALWIFLGVTIETKSVTLSIKTRWLNPADQCGDSWPQFSNVTQNLKNVTILWLLIFNMWAGCYESEVLFSVVPSSQVVINE